MDIVIVGIIKGSFYYLSGSPFEFFFFKLSRRRELEIFIKCYPSFSIKYQLFKPQKKSVKLFLTERNTKGESEFNCPYKGMSVINLHSIVVI